MLATAADVVKLMERIGKRVWVNQPSTHDRWNRFHGQTGYLIGGTLHLCPVTSNSAVELEVTPREISSGWPGVDMWHLPR